MSPILPAEPVIDVRNIVKSFSGRRVVDGISIQIQSGEVFGFLGPNGSGKTTLLRILCGLIRADGGEGSCLGFELGGCADDIKRSMGYMTQRFSLYEELSVRENLEFVGRVYGVKKLSEAVHRTLDEHGFWERQSQLAGELSGGWRQRLALAAAVMHQPRLLLLDEPTAGVDPKARRDFWRRIHQCASEGVTVLVTTHYMDEAERCHRIGALLNGRLLAEGGRNEIVDRAGLKTWELIGPGLEKVRQQLSERLPGAQVVEFGSAIHVSAVGVMVHEVASSLERLAGSGVKTRSVETSLEDAFIHRTSQDL